jgi:plasmid maintenance system antidote protein VapI
MIEQRERTSNSPMKQWLEERHLSQRALAKLLGISSATVNGKVNGWVAWQPKDLEILHDEFGLSSDFVLGFLSIEGGEYNHDA